MTHFRNVLVVHGSSIGSEDALAQGIAIAAGSGARLTVAAPLDPSIPCTPHSVREMKSRMRRLETSVKSEGISDLNTEVLCGTPHVDVIRRVLRHGHDLVVTCDTVRHSFWDWLRPSVATQLLRHCPCPVLLVPAGQAAPMRRVLAVIEMDAGDGPIDPTSRNIVSTAATLAFAQSAELHVLCCWQAQDVEFDLLRSEIRDQTRQEIIDRNEERYRERIEALLAEIDARCATRIHLPRSSFLNTEVAGLVTRERLDVVVTGSGYGDLALRSTPAAFPDYIPRRSACAVLAVKPDWFQSSVVQAAMEAVGPSARYPNFQAGRLKIAVR